MNNRTHLGNELQTTCTHCNSVFRINIEQLDAARGQVRCSQCMQVFNALINLENYSGQPILETHDAEQELEVSSDHNTEPSLFSKEKINNEETSLSLREAMYGDDHKSDQSLKPVLWAVGILLLIIISTIQVIYYQRYQLISSSQYQQQILNLCQLLPCDSNRFSNPSQIRMVERNVFSHPTQKKALMITGSFINDAPFEQSMPDLLISLSDVKGNLIANRQFTAEEYLIDKSRHSLAPGRSTQFKLEIVDPGTDALTYEFEFVS
jgi:predicted Zn finger-like uncharacterized protein